VIEDGTDPLNPADDLQLFRLQIEFDYDKADLRSVYHEQLDKIIKGAAARSRRHGPHRGHADKRKTSKRDYI
jgi:outer membrane protein OmpA-like peptidoglycan-associated protein